MFIFKIKEIFLQTFIVLFIDLFNETINFIFIFSGLVFLSKLFFSCLIRDLSSSIYHPEIHFPHLKITFLLQLHSYHFVRFILVI